MPDDFLSEVGALAAQVKRCASVNVNSKALKDSTISITKKYFEEIRPKLVLSGIEDQDVVELDAAWQDLFKLAHSNNKKTTYLKQLKRISNGLLSLSVRTLRPRASDIRVQAFGSTDTKIMETLGRMVPTAEESYRQGVIDLDISHPRRSYRGTANEFREVLREVLDTLAPDSALMSDPTFKLEEGRPNPTMTQKAAFILKSRGRNKTQLQSPKNAVDAIESILGSLARSVYDRASISSHVATSRLEVTRLKNYLDAVLIDLLELPQ